MQKEPDEPLKLVFAFWRTHLRLQDWDIDFLLAGPGDLVKRSAQCDIVAQHKAATITLRSLGVVDRTLEEDLVHELLHLVFLQMSILSADKPDAEQVWNEQGLNTTAAVLVNLRRKAGLKLR